MIPALSRILIVEDERVVAKDIEIRLQRMGYAVSAVVSSGKEALKQAEAQHPDLVLMDIRLRGEMDGIAAATHIRKRFNIPVIFLTAFGDKDTLNKAKISEPFGYLTKPFVESGLRAAIEIALYNATRKKSAKEPDVSSSPISVKAALALGQSKGLTPAELSTLELLASGFSQSSIATIQNRNINTVKTHLRNVYQKLNIEGQADLLRVLF